MKHAFAFKSILILLGILSVSACYQRKTVNYLQLHPEEIKPLYDQCVALEGRMNAYQASDCNNILKVLPIFRTLVDEFVNNPNQFALDIMHAEIKLIALQKSYQVAKKAGKPELVNQLKREIDELKLGIQSRFALIRLVGNNG